MTALCHLVPGCMGKQMQKESWKGVEIRVQRHECRFGAKSDAKKWRKPKGIYTIIKCLMKWIVCINLTTPKFPCFRLLEYFVIIISWGKIVMDKQPFLSTIHQKLIRSKALVSIKSQLMHRAAHTHCYPLSVSQLRPTYTIEQTI